MDSINAYAAEVRELEAKVLAEQQAVLQARAQITQPILPLPHPRWPSSRLCTPGARLDNTLSYPYPTLAGRAAGRAPGARPSNTLSYSYPTLFAAQG